MNKIILSILIPSIPERAEKLNALLMELYCQYDEFQKFHYTLGQAEFIFDDSKRFLQGGLSIGKKRESLVSRAKGKYLCFLDDDETIAPNYIETLIRLCSENKDVCTFRNISKLDNFWTIVDMSLYHSVNEQASPDNIIKRKPWHICPVRTKYAKKYGFQDSNYGEDWQWFEQVLTECLTEAKSNAIIHQYNHSKINSEADKITNYVFTKPGREDHP